MDKLNVKRMEEDISRQKPFIGGVIDKVGIEGLEIPVWVDSGSQTLQLQSDVTAMVSLDNEICGVFICPAFTWLCMIFWKPGH